MDDIKASAAKHHEDAAYQYEMAAEMHREAAKHCASGVVQNLPFSGYRGARKQPALTGRIFGSKVVLWGGDQPPRLTLAWAEAARGPAA